MPRQASKPAQTGLLVLCLLLSASAFVHLWNLGGAPAYLGGDEAHSAIQAHSISTTGRDLEGHFLPLFFNTENPLPGSQGQNLWWQPILIYLQALALKLFPLTEWTIRSPSAFIALLNIALVYLVATRLFPGTMYPLIASLLLALTPAHLLFGRQGLDYLAPVPFVLAWLWCLATFLETARLPFAFAAGLALGVGVYSYVASWALMPIYLLLTLAALSRSQKRFALPVTMAIAGFVLALIPLLLFVRTHPQMVGELFGRYQRSPGALQLTFLQGLRESLTYNNVQDKIHVYWNYLNPSFLFFTGGVNLTHGTRFVGVFLIPVCVFLSVGIYELLKRGRSLVFGVVLVAGFFTAPLPAALFGQIGSIQRELVVLPFAALISTYGVAALLSRPNHLARAVAIALLLAMPIQYAVFLNDYFGEYQIRTAVWYDPVNFREVARNLMALDARSKAPVIYLSNDLDDGTSRWLFYLLKHGREELWSRTREFQSARVVLSEIEPGALLVLYSNDPQVEGWSNSEDWVREALVAHFYGSPAAVILRKR